MSYIRYSAGNHNWYIYATDDAKGTTYLEIDYQNKEFIRFDIDDNKIMFIVNLSKRLNLTFEDKKILSDCIDEFIKDYKEEANND